MLAPWGSRPEPRSKGKRSLKRPRRRGAARNSRRRPQGRNADLLRAADPDRDGVLDRAELRSSQGKALARLLR